MKNKLTSAILALLMLSCTSENSEVLNAETTDSKSKDSNSSRVVTSGGTTTITGQYEVYQDPNYQWAFIQNNIWSIDDGDKGADPNQFIWYNNINSWGVRAYTTTGKYSYSGVKSYPSLVFGRHYNTVSQNGNGFPKQISKITSNLNTEWSTYVENDGGSGAKYNASYDIWFDPSSNQTGRNKYEIMIWTLRKGQWPINENNDINRPWKANVLVFNARYDVYKGSIAGGQQQVLTFILKGGTGYFKAPLKAFIDSAVNWGWMGNNNYLTSIQAGFEICTAGVNNSSKANFVTNKFSLGI
jgi:hypothetical protein